MSQSLFEFSQFWAHSRSAARETTVHLIVERNMSC